MSQFYHYISVFLILDVGLISTWLVFSMPVDGLPIHFFFIFSRNKFCFTGGYLETSVQLPGANNVLGFWPAIWASGNLGRAGYGASLDGVVRDLSMPFFWLLITCNHESGHMHMIPVT